MVWARRVPCRPLVSRARAWRHGAARGRGQRPGPDGRSAKAPATRAYALSRRDYRRRGWRKIPSSKRPEFPVFGNGGAPRPAIDRGRRTTAAGPAIARAARGRTAPVATIVLARELASVVRRVGRLAGDSSARAGQLTQRINGGRRWPKPRRSRSFLKAAQPSCRAIRECQSETVGIRRMRRRHLRLPRPPALANPAVRPEDRSP